MSRLVLKAPVAHIPLFKEYRIGLADLWEKYDDLGVVCPFPASDWWYYYTDVEGWNKILPDLTFNSSLYKPDKFDCPLPEDLAFTFGLFFADGHCNLRNEKAGGANWKITNTNPELLEHCIAPLEREWTNLKFVIREYPSEARGKITNYGTRNLGLCNLEVRMKDRHNDSNRGSFVQDFRQMFYTELGYKKVPGCILESPLETKANFMYGVIEGDGYKAQHNIGVSGNPGRDSLIVILNDLGWLGAVRREERREDFWYLHYTFRNQWDAFVLEFLENNRDTFFNVKQLGDNFGLSINTAMGIVDRLESGGNIICERPWSKRRKVKFLVGRIPHCEDYALKAQGVCAERYGLNTLRYTYGDTPFGRHGFCTFWTGEEFLIFEPNTNGLDNLEGYLPLQVLL